MSIARLIDGPWQSLPAYLQWRPSRGRCGRVGLSPSHEVPPVLLSMRAAALAFKVFLVRLWLDRRSRARPAANDQAQMAKELPMINNQTQRPVA